MIDFRRHGLKGLLTGDRGSHVEPAAYETDADAEASLVRVLMAEFVNSATFAGVVASMVTAKKSARPIRMIGPAASYLPPEPMIFPALTSGLVFAADHSALVDSLQNYYMKLAFARSVTKIPDEIWQRETPADELHWADFADIWQHICAAAIVVIHCSYNAPFTGNTQNQSTLSGLHQMLMNAVRGECPCVRHDGRLIIPGLLDQRKSERKRLDRALWIEARHGRARVILKDISTSGLGLASCPSFEPGERVSVQLADGRILAAFIVWSKDGRAGARLIQPLSEKDPLLCSEMPSSGGLQ